MRDISEALKKLIEKYPEKIVNGRKTRILPKKLYKKVQDAQKREPVPINENKRMRKNFEKQGFTNIRIRNGQIYSARKNGKEITFNQE